jgi:hypothetical protein
MLTHELNNYTMQAAIDNYPALAKAFDVRFCSSFCFPSFAIFSVSPSPCPSPTSSR